jgi:hypothetical protein
MLKVVADEAAREDLAASLDEIVREGVRRMLAALEDEVGAYIAAHAALPAVGLPGSNLTLQARRQELLMGPRFSAGPLSQARH